MIILVGGDLGVGRCSGMSWNNINNISSLLTFMSPIRVGIIIFPHIASVYVIDVLVLNVTLRIKFYFDIQTVRYTKMAYLILGGEDMGTFGLEGRRCRIIQSPRGHETPLRSQSKRQVPCGI
jgi:hypothetical protein